MKIYLEFRSLKHHTLYDELINFPPEGVDYVVSSGEVYSTRKYKVFNFLYNKFIKNIAPNIGNVYHKLKKENAGVDLVHICNNFTPRDSPWVVDIENVGSFTGHDKQILLSQKKNIEKQLSSKHCKKIMPWMSASKKTLERFLDIKGFEDKIEVVKPAIHPMPRMEKQKHEKIMLLFISSINHPHTFIVKGGLYALESFKKLSAKYDVELIVRSIVPEDIKRNYLNLEGLKFIEELLPQQELFNIYNNSDIFILPGHNYTLMATLECMAFGLPTVAIDGWATNEFVEDGKTGFLVEPSELIPVKEDIPIDWTPGFWENVEKVDQKVVEGLVDKIKVLIENDSLRREMGMRARKRIEQGDLSIDHRNRKLRRIYEEVLKS